MASFCAPAAAEVPISARSGHLQLLGSGARLLACLELSPDGNAEGKLLSVMSGGGAAAATWLGSLVFCWCYHCRGGDLQRWRPLEAVTLRGLLPCEGLPGECVRTRA